jgi:hypothetical protein
MLWRHQDIFSIVLLANRQADREKCMPDYIALVPPSPERAFPMVWTRLSHFATLRQGDPSRQLLVDPIHLGKIHWPQ